MVPVDVAGDTEPGLLGDRRRARELEPSLGGAVHEALGEHVGRHLVDRRGEPQRLVAP